MTYLTEMNPETGMIPSEVARNKGQELKERYNAAKPFPHIMIDDFVPPDLLETCIANFPKRDAGVSVFDREQERYKAQYNPDTLPAHVRAIFYALNSRPFIRVLENITGIKGLIPDPYFAGGGFHEISQGGHLSVHADFNHHRPLNLERRINLLLYLNKDWKAENGGQLELWSDDMAKCLVSLVPLFNRCVIFNTTSNSNHGNPNPINHPLGIPRRSIALYYYTATWDGTKRDHTTQFRTRAGSPDQVDWQVKAAELSEDFIPPFVLRNFRRVKRRLIGR